MDLERIKTEHKRVDEIYQMLSLSAPIFFKKIIPIVEKYKVSSEILTQELIKYLIITSQSNQTTSPCYIVDLAWHELILFTRFYEKLCKEKLEKFIHHTPSENENPEAFNYTLELYQQIFTNPPKEIWFPTIAFNIDDVECGACHN